MNNINSLFRVSLLAASLALAACSGKSKVGEQDSLAPTAVVGIVGYTGSGLGGDAQANVRAQTEVLITGKDSVEGDKPIVSFLWEPANAAAQGVPLTVRNTSTVNVTVPRLTTATDLQYKLTITDSDGDRDDALVTLRVQPVIDQSKFLTYLDSTSKLRLVAATSSYVGGGSFQIQLRGRLTYARRPSSETNRVFNTIDYDIGAPVTGQWLADNNPASNSPTTDPRNPVFVFDVPSVNMDDAIRRYQAGLPGTAGQMPDPAFIDDARLEVFARLVPTSGGGTITLYAINADGSNTIPPVNNGGAGTAVELAFTAADVEALRLSGGGRENLATTTSYYQAIDPDNRKLTMRQWMTENCFDPAATNYGATTHAVYVNNYDLGFGRDMYMHGTRPAGCTSTTFRPGDAATIVINYATLENAVKKVDAFIAVAMEYKAVDANRSAPGIVTFYVFAPDEGSGEFRRVSSANFDGRGEKSVPGACNACHGGRPRQPNVATPLSTYTPGPVNNPYFAASTNTGATFMPWDLESFLFSDTDPVFPNDPSHATLRATYTRAAQEAQFKQLNIAALGTYSSGTGNQLTCHAGYEGPCDLVHLWYGNDMSSPTFRNDQVPTAWSGGQASRLYLDVFARNCRACHTQRVSEPGGDNPDPLFATYDEFVDQSDRIREMVFEQGAMPAARLTADRLWTFRVNNETTGAALARHLGFDPALTPGSPVAKQVLTQATAIGANTYDEMLEDPNDETILLANRRRTIRVDGQGSAFPQSFTQSVQVAGGSAATLTGTNNSVATLTPDVPGTYRFTLNVGGNGAAATRTQTVNVVNIPPEVPAGSSHTVNQGALLTVNVAQGVLEGATDGDGDTLSAALTQGGGSCAMPAHGQVVLNANGSFTYQHNGDLANSDSFEAYVTDGFGGTAFTCVTITILSVPDSQPPTAPSIYSISPSTTPSPTRRYPVSLSWTGSTDTDQFNNPRALQGYQVYRRVGGSGGFSAVSGVLSPATLSYTDNTSATNPAPNTIYQYTVRAIDLNGNQTASGASGVTTRSSFVTNVYPIFGRCQSCHSHPFVGADAPGTYTALSGYTMTGGNAANGQVPCYPSQQCTNGHGGGLQLQTGAVLVGDDAATIERKQDYQNIVKWLSEGRVDN